MVEQDADLSLQLTAMEVIRTIKNVRRNDYLFVFFCFFFLVVSYTSGRGGGTLV